MKQEIKDEPLNMEEKEQLVSGMFSLFSKENTQFVSKEKYEKLQHNWDELKSWLEEQGQKYKNEEEKAYPYFYVWKRMQELEKNARD